MAMRSLVLFEIENDVQKMGPVNKMRHTALLRTGAYSIAEKWRRRFPDLPLYLTGRSYLDKINAEEGFSIASEKLAGDVLYINSQATPDTKLSEAIGKLKTGEGLTLNAQIIAFVARGMRRENAYKDNITYSEYPHQVNWMMYPWDLVEGNGLQLLEDLSMARTSLKKMLIADPNVSCINPENIYLGGEVTLMPRVVIDASAGPVWIEDGATVMPFSYIQGPVYIGKNSTIKPQTRLFAGSIGPMCKVAGEISASIFHSYANKQHDGFVGSSYFSPWVNLGADTNTSNLKNNYSPVKVPLNGRNLHTNLQFAGLFAGDHAKSGINTMFNTGTSMGLFSNIYGGDFPPRYIPDFAWGGASGFKMGHLDRTLETAAIVKKRRHKDLSEAEAEVITQLFNEAKESFRNE
jgi:UDP-N-acetylglucosamine diphosphorylase/glucosamine-1-phosphate N-acetyltransferase